MHTAQSAFRRQTRGTLSSWSCKTGTRLQPSTEVPPGEGTGDRLPAAQAMEGPGLQTGTTGLGQDWELWPTLNGSPEPWVEGMGGGLRSNCSLHMGYLVCSVLCLTSHHTPNRDASPLAVWIQFLIFEGNKEPARFTCWFLSWAGCELPLEATVLPGDMAPQIPASCPETPC